MHQNQLVRLTDSASLSDITSGTDTPLRAARILSKCRNQLKVSRYLQNCTSTSQLQQKDHPPQTNSLEFVLYSIPCFPEY